jgi:hypothetical protein
MLVLCKELAAAARLEDALGACMLAAHLLFDGTRDGAWKQHDSSTKQRDGEPMG